MRKRRGLALTCLCMLVFCMAMIDRIAWSENKKIVLVTSNKEDFPHLVGNDEQVRNHYPGVAVEVINALAARKNLTIEIRRLPWKRCFKALASGEADGLFFAGFDQRRLEYGVFPMKENTVDASKRYGDAVYCFYRLKGSSVDWDGEKLINFRGTIGASRGLSVIPFLRKRDLFIDESPGPLSDFQKLVKNRVQLVAALDHNADHILAVFPELGAKIEKIPQPVLSNSYYLIFSHQFFSAHRTTAVEAWEALGELREELFQQLLEQYFLQFSKELYER